MPTCLIAMIGAGDETSAKLCDRNPSRCVLGVYNNDAAAILFVTDTPGVVAYAVEPKGTLALLAVDGYDVTKPWYAWFSDLGTDLVMVHEEFLPDVVMAVLKAKGINTTQGLGWLLLAAGLLA